MDTRKHRVAAVEARLVEINRAFTRVRFGSAGWEALRDETINLTGQLQELRTGRERRSNATDRLAGMMGYTRGEARRAVKGEPIDWHAPARRRRDAWLVASGAVTRRELGRYRSCSPAVGPAVGRSTQRRSRRQTGSTSSRSARDGPSPSGSDASPLDRLGDAALYGCLLVLAAVEVFLLVEVLR